MGKDQAVAGLQQVQKTAENMGKGQVTFPWLKDILPQAGKVSGAVAKIGEEAKKGVGPMGDLEKAMRRAVIVAPVWLALRAAMMGVLQLVKDQVKFLIDLENAMTRIKIVGKGTTEEFANLKDSLIALSIAYGTSATDSLEAAKTFSQQGRTVIETLKLTQVAMIGAQVLGENVKTTVDNMTAAMNAFNISADESTTIVDKWINVEKNFAVTSKDLAEATKVAGATANQMGVSISEFLGDVTAIIEVTRKSGSEAARGLSFVYARLYTTAQKTISQISKIKFYLDEQKKATNELTGVLRPASDILGELAVKWETLTKEEKLQIATSLGSKRQMVTVNALLQNYNRSIDARIKALTSAGEAEKAFNLIQDTTSFKLKQVTSSWNSLTNALGDTSIFKDALDVMKNFLTNLTYLIDAEKGYRAAISGTITQQILAAEAEGSRVANLKEVIALRDKLLGQPPSDVTTKRIELLNEAIKEISTTQPNIQIALASGDTGQLDKAIKAAQDDVLKSVVTLRVRLQFLPQIREAEKEAESLISNVTGSREVFQQKILRLQNKQTEEIEKQYKAALVQREIEAGKLSDLEDEEEILAELTDKEKEGLKIAQQISLFNIQNKDSKEKQLLNEIESVRNSQFQYDIHQKSLKLEELQNELIEARMKDKEREKNFAYDLYTQTLKLQGATESYINAQEAALTKQMFGEDALTNNLKLRLAAEERITKEKLNQVEIGNDTLTLFKVAQKEGIGIATELGKFLAPGGTTFDQLKEMPRVFEAFKKYFSTRFEELQAASFFGIPFRGQGGLGGQRRLGSQGFSVPIPEFEGRNATRPSIGPTTISGLTINVDASVEGQTKEQRAINLQKQIAEAIESDPEVKKAIFDKIEEY
jgi:TP901 family phage tail tape measure protein